LIGQNENNLEKIWGYNVKGVYTVYVPIFIRFENVYNLSIDNIHTKLKLGYNTPRYLFWSLFFELHT